MINEKPNRQLYANCICAAIMVLFFGGLAQYLRIGVGIPLIREGILILLAVSVLPLIVNALREGVEVHPIAIWVYFYIAILSFWVFRADTSTTALREMASAAYFVTVLIITAFAVGRSSSFVWISRLALYISIVAVGLNLWDFFAPMTFSNVPGRAAGLHVNPTISGEALVLGLILSIDRVCPRYWGVYQGLIGLGVAVTFSRAGLLAFAVVVLLQYLSPGEVKGRSGSWILLLVSIPLFLVSPLWERLQHQFVAGSFNSERLLERLKFFQSESTLEDSRVVLARQAWDRISKNPLLGSGTGSELFESASGHIQGPHNMWLSMMIQFGTVGAILLLSFFFLAWWSARVSVEPWKSMATIIVVYLVVQSFFTHNMFEQGHYAVVIGIVSQLPRAQAFIQRSSTKVSPSLGMPERSHG